MNRRQRHDVVIAGGGVVGATCALALAGQGLDVVLVEPQAPRPWSIQQPDLRVVAFAPDNAALLDRLGVWRQVLAARAQVYRRMHVWDAAGGDALVFNADAFAQPALGWIVENGLLVDRLWQALRDSTVRVQCPARVTAFAQEDDGVRVQLDEGTWLQARIAVAADGAQSTLRDLAGVQVGGHDYGQRGVVGYVRCAQGHQDTAWQRFLPGGPLALLPWQDDACSIVWSLPDDEATRVLALDDEAFGRELTDASGGRLGAIRALGPRAAFPLRLQLSQTQCQGRLLVMGDAAHVVHPLAGQGVNLGLRDVSALLASVAAAQGRGMAWDSAHRLARWARARRSDNTVSARAFDAINRVFSNDGVACTLGRGHVLGLAGRVPPLAHALWRHAAGL